MKLFLFLVAILSFASQSEAAVAEPRLSVVFDGKEGKYEVVRTPQLLVTKVGTFLAFAQGRAGNHDRSDNDIILKRSTDGGLTWSKFQVIADEGKDSLNSICVVQLRETGRILVVGCRFPDGYEMEEFQYLSPGLQEYHKNAGHDKNPAIKPGYEGVDTARNYVIQSDDDGRTWSPLRDITREAKRPAPDLCCVPGPGVAIELREGPHMLAASSCPAGRAGWKRRLKRSATARCPMPSSVTMGAGSGSAASLLLTANPAASIKPTRRRWWSFPGVASCSMRALMAATWP